MMRRESLKFLRELLDAPSPSGFEGPAQRVVREYLRRYADEVRTDVHGNVIAVKNPEGKPRVMLAGHCDEVGFAVSHISDEGFIHFQAIGGVDVAVVIGQKVIIHTKNGPVTGVVGRKAIHLLEGGERDKVPKLHQLWIDIGAKDRKEAEGLVSLGDPITFATQFELMRNEVALARHFDDKIGVFAVCEVMRLLSNKQLSAALYVVSTVQEEIGLRGARTSAFGINPDVGIAVDVEHATDHPGSDKKREGDVKLGKGPVLYRGANINPVVGEMLIEIAKKKRIPYQFKVVTGGTGTDANAIQITRAGVAAGLVGIPNRYMHSPVELVSLRDVENAVKLLAAFVESLTPDTSFIPE